MLGDVHVKHAAPLFDVPIEDAAADLAERGGADAVIVSGARSAFPPSYERVKAVRDVIDKPVFIGSGVGLENVREFYDRSDGVLIGEVDFKVGRVWGGASDEAAYAEAVRLAQRLRPSRRDGPGDRAQRRPRLERRHGRRYGTIADVQALARRPTDALARAAVGGPRRQPCVRGPAAPDLPRDHR